ncbi:MAG: hypothetical protein Fur009_8360 [Candidatus Microgenomates bacterium]
MKKGGIGGGNTLTGLNFEKSRNLIEIFNKINGYKVLKAKIGWNIYFKNQLVANSFKKYEFYKFIENKGVNWKEVLSKRLIPDDTLYVIVNNTLFILELKYQQVSGSVDEKLQTCDFKRKQFKKLLSRINIDVEYVYILSDWFRKPEYKDVLDYIISVGCHYYFNYLPLKKLGLPVS